MELKEVGEVCVDSANKLVTSPAYMSGTAKFHEVGLEDVIMVTFGPGPGRRLQHGPGAAQDGLKNPNLQL